MLVPGSNLLNMAFSLIAQQQVQWLKYTGQTVTPAGYEVAAFADPVTISGSVQAVPNTMLQNLGLDWTKNYIMFYTSLELTEPVRDKTGDRLIYAGKTYSVQSATPWFAQDGWESVLCVEVTNA